jgi:hypothetical protein
MCQRDPIRCIIPPYITERLLRSDDAEVRARRGEHHRRSEHASGASAGPGRAIAHGSACAGGWKAPPGL